MATNNGITFTEKDLDEIWDAVSVRDKWEGESWTIIIEWDESELWRKVNDFWVLTVDEVSEQARYILWY